ncbi:TPA: hypothetical protein DEG21_00385 [Patescibacteria group bacterium]|nr:hypothetical protein [Candidatus Gracilibacteria bacterium]
MQTAKYLSTDSDLNIYIISGLQKEELIKDYRKDNLKFIEVKMPPTSSFVFWILYPIWLFKVLKKISELYKSLE